MDSGNIHIMSYHVIVRWFYMVFKCVQTDVLKSLKLDVGQFVLIMPPSLRKVATKRPEPSGDSAEVLPSDHVLIYFLARRCGDVTKVTNK